MAVSQVLPLKNGRTEACLPITGFPVYVNHHAATVAETETVPAGAYRVIITPDADAWFSDGTAVVPAGDVVDGTGSFLIAAGVARAFYVKPGQTISVISASGTANVSFEYFAKDIQ